MSAFSAGRVKTLPKLDYLHAPYTGLKIPAGGCSVNVSDTVTALTSHKPSWRQPVGSAVLKVIISKSDRTTRVMVMQLCTFGHPIAVQYGLMYLRSISEFVFSHVESSTVFYQTTQTSSKDLAIYHIPVISTGMWMTCGERAWSNIAGPASHVMEIEKEI